MLLIFGSMLSVAEYTLALATQGFPMNTRFSILDAMAIAEWGVVLGGLNLIPIVVGIGGLIMFAFGSKGVQWKVAAAMLIFGALVSIVGLGLKDGLLIHASGLLFAPVFLFAQVGGGDGDFYADGVAQFISAGLWTFVWFIALNRGLSHSQLMEDNHVAQTTERLGMKSKTLNKKIGSDTSV